VVHNDRSQLLEDLEEGNYGPVSDHADNFLWASDKLLSAEMDIIGYEVRANASDKNDYSDFDSDVSFDNLMDHKTKYINARGEVQDLADDMFEAFANGAGPDTLGDYEDKIREAQGNLTLALEDTLDAYREYRVAEVGDEIHARSVRSASIAAGDVGALQEVRLTPPKKKRL